MLIKQGLDFVQLVRNVVKKELSHTGSSLFNSLKATNLTVYQLPSKHIILVSPRKRKRVIALQ